MARTRRLSLLAPLGLVLVLVLTLAACGGGHAKAKENAASGCSPVTPPAPRAKHEPKPTQQLDASKIWDVRFQTNCGSFTIRLAVRTSPTTTASFVSLTRKKYFDGTVFHRIVPGFVIQGGDPTAKGEGGPGYSTVDAPPASTRYTFGLAAMAKAQDEARGTGGSQFFVVTAPEAQLAPDYAVLGRVIAGTNVVRRIGRLGSDTTERPTEIIEIEHATVVRH